MEGQADSMHHLVHDHRPLSEHSFNRFPWLEIWVSTRQRYANVTMNSKISMGEVDATNPSILVNTLVR